MTSVIAALCHSPLFAGLSDTTIEQEIMPYGKTQDYQKGQYLILPQQKVNKLGIVITGKIQILHIFSDGTQSLMNTIREQGVLGADLVCTRTQRAPFHAIAAANTRIFYLPSSIIIETGTLREEVRQKILSQMLYLISRENMRKEYRLAILSQKGLRERILTYLTMQSERQQKTTFTIPFSREEMASFLCVNRSALSHELGKLQKEGILSFRKNQFTLHASIQNSARK